jgi:hypothetical protein
MRLKWRRKYKHAVEMIGLDLSRGSWPQAGGGYAFWQQHVAATATWFNPDQVRHKHLAQSPLRRHRLEPRQPRHSYRLSRSSAPAPATISNPFSFIWGRFLSLLETPKNEGTRLIRSEIGQPKGDNEVFPVRLHTGES